MADVTFSWRVSRRDGRLDEPTRFTVPDDVADHLRGLWEQIERTRPGTRRTVLVRELRCQLEVCALFDVSFAEVEQAQAQAAA